MKRLMMSVFPLAMVVGLLASTVIIFAALQAAPAAINAPAASENLEVVETVDPVAHGKELFIAKGCIVCHVNNRAMTAREGMMDFSDVPNLTTVKLDRDYLKKWLHDPTAVKPSAEMPKLELSDAELDALVAFLVADGK